MYCGLPSAFGGGSRNCDARINTHGVIVANCGPAAVVPAAVGRQKPTRSIPTKPGAGSGAKPSVDLAARTASATYWPYINPAFISFGLSASGPEEIPASDAVRCPFSEVTELGYSFAR